MVLQNMIYISIMPNQMKIENFTNMIMPLAMFFGCLPKQYFADGCHISVIKAFSRVMKRTSALEIWNSAPYLWCRFHENGILMHFTRQWPVSFYWPWSAFALFFQPQPLLIHFSVHLYNLIIHWGNLISSEGHYTKLAAWLLYKWRDQRTADRIIPN